MKTISLLALLVAAAAVSGCASTPPRAGTDYPATYSIPLGELSPGATAPAASTSFNQQVEVVPRELLYYRVNSPIDVTVSVYEFDAKGQRVLLGQMRGTSFTTSVMPSTARVEFNVDPSPAAPNGLVHVTVSNEPIPTGQIASVMAE